MPERTANERLLDAEVKGRQAMQISEDARNLAKTAIVIALAALVVALVALLRTH